MSDTAPSPRPSDDRLESWKEIAAYLKKGVRTVQRWERTDGLPVRRLGQDRTGLVFAYKSEIDAWWEEQSRRESPQPVEPPKPDAPSRRGSRWWIGITASAVAAAGIVAGVMLWIERPSGPLVDRLIPLTTEHGEESRPSFSPDGQEIVYVWSQPETPPAIYRKRIGAGSGVRVTVGTDPEVSPAWSPDGRWIAFLRRSAQGLALMLIPASGGAEREVAELDHASVLTWSPDNEWLIVRDEDKDGNSLAAISVASGARHTLTTPTYVGFQGAALSSDLRRLVYARSGFGQSEVYERALGPQLAPEGAPRLVDKFWSREMLIDADRMAAIYTDGSWEEEGFKIYRKRFGHRPEVLYQSARAMHLDLSPDGRRLAMAVVKEYREDTWRLSLDGSGETSPLLSSTHSDLNPQYSPDGKRIAFHSTRSGGSDIWVADSDGARPRRLTFTNARTTATPRWSPDGKWIAFESNEPGQSEVYLVPSGGGSIRRLTFNPALDAIPSWSRDGRTLYFCSDRTGRFELWKMPSMGGEATQVTTAGGFAAVESVDGKTLYYSQTRNSGPVLRMPVTGGAAEAIIPEIRGLFFAVTNRGIYYQTVQSIAFWDAGTGEREEVLRPPKRLGIGLAVSPDARTLLYTQIEFQGMDLYMADGLR